MSGVKEDGAEDGKQTVQLRLDQGAQTQGRPAATERQAATGDATTGHQEQSNCS